MGVFVATAIFPLICCELVEDWPLESLKENAESCLAKKNKKNCGGNGDVAGMMMVGAARALPVLVFGSWSRAALPSKPRPNPKLRKCRTSTWRLNQPVT